MDLPSCEYTLTLPSLTTHSQIPISWHLKAAGSRHKSYFQLYWSCKKHWGRQDCEVIYLYHPQAELFLSLSLDLLLTTRNKDDHNAYYLTVLIHSPLLSHAALLLSLSPAFLLTFPMHSSLLFPCIPFLSLPLSSLHSCAVIPALLTHPFWEW